MNRRRFLSWCAAIPAFFGFGAKAREFDDVLDPFTEPPKPRRKWVTNPKVSLRGASSRKYLFRNRAIPKVCDNQILTSDYLNEVVARINRK